MKYHYLHRFFTYLVRRGRVRSREWTPAFGDKLLVLHR